MFKTKAALAAAAIMLATPAYAASTVPEQESNDSFETAQFLTIDSSEGIQVIGSLEGSSTDYIDFSAFRTR
jgi:hypothetical protein